MKKRSIAMLIAAIMLAALFAGCRTDQGSGYVTESGLEEVTLRFIFFDTKRPATDQVWQTIADTFREELNVRFDVQFIAGSDYADRILTMAAAGESWDLNFDGDWLSYYRMANLGAFLPLNDLMPVYAPDLYAAYQASGVLSAATVNGNIVAMPWGNVMSNRPYFQWRGDLIDVDPATVNTVEDVEALVYQLKELYPDKYIVENVDVNAFLLRDNLIDIGNNFVYDASSGDFTVTYRALTDAYRDRAVMAEKWQMDGLIWADILINRLDHNVLINQGQLITKWGTYEFSRSHRAWIEPDAHWGFAELYPGNYYQNRTALANLVAIPRTSQNPERTLMFLNLLETNQELYDLVHYGILGVTYELNEDGSARFPDGMNASNSNFMLWQGRWGLWKPQFMRGDPEFARGFWYDELVHAQSNPNNIVSALDGFNFNAEAVIVEMSQISAIFEAAEEMLDVGLAGDPNAAVDRLIADLNRAGLERVTAEMQRQVNEFLGIQ